MLAVRYKDPGEQEVLLDLSPKQYEQITDEDIFETLGIKGICLELRKVINIFQSEDEFVDKMSNPLCDGEAELYLQDSFDEQDGIESNNAYVVFSAVDVAKVMDISVKDATEAIYIVAKNIEKITDLWVKEESIVNSSVLLYMICVAHQLRDSYGRNSSAVYYALKELKDVYYGDKNRRIVDDLGKWKDLIRDVVS